MIKSKTGSNSENKGAEQGLVLEQEVLATQILSRGSGPFPSLPGGIGASIWAKGNRKKTHLVTAGSGTLVGEQRSSDFSFQRLEGGSWDKGAGEGASACPSEEKIKSDLKPVHCPGDSQEQELAETR